LPKRHRADDRRPDHMTTRSQAAQILRIPVAERDTTARILGSSHRTPVRNTPEAVASQTSNAPRWLTDGSNEADHPELRLRER